MNRSSLDRLTAFVGAAVIVAMIFVVGCSENPLGTPSEQPQPQILKRTTDYAAKILEGDLYAEQTIPAKYGGRLTLFDVTLEIPPGAVKNDTIFSINIPDPKEFYNEFGTDGLVFSKPVTVIMSYRDADLSNVDESTIRIAWFNERTGAFEDMVCEIDFENKVVIGQLDHFSAYALISDYLGGGPI